MKKAGQFSDERTRKFREKGFTLMEIVIAGTISAMFAGVLIAALTASRQVCTRISAEQGLQQVANVILNKIVKGSFEPGNGTIRLSEASQCTINNLTSLSFQMNDSPNPQIRRYYLANVGNGRTSLLYNHPTAAGVQDEVIYTAPAGTSLKLRFRPSEDNPLDSTSVGIDIAIIQTISGRTISAEASTLVNLRNRGRL